MSGLYTTLIVLAAIASYVIVGIRLMRLCDVSGVSLGWFSFIPLLAETRMARLGGMNPWLVLLGLIPLVNIILLILRWVWLWRISGHTDARQWWWVSLLGPIAIGLVSGIFRDGGILWFLISIIGIAVMTYALMMIFNPLKPIPASAIQGPTEGSTPAAA